jgi:hypothetical protein
MLAKEDKKLARSMSVRSAEHTLPKPEPKPPISGQWKRHWLASVGIGGQWPPIHFPVESTGNNDQMKIPQDGLFSSGIWQLPLDSQST